MAETAVDDPVLRLLRAELEREYGDRLERVVLFGSRARGDHREDSDYDVAVFLHDMGDFWGEVHKLGGIRFDSLGDEGHLVSAKPFAAGSYQERTPIMHEIRKDGIDL